ncbi:hypothetical protein SAMN05216345_10362 [Cupriavidus sp. YR651]|uniref:hypothetical protein n=1 Tax=Cupriavidus sp. YR651 TaxID=1855315 RepID=UPI0008893BE0|nr:hypothetical protein [Cupriavidus sp. YR651]SDC62801.1 hypothetical protein SAMN05216345_10362 [Cupriavidus sp. YR651]
MADEKMTVFDTPESDDIAYRPYNRGALLRMAEKGRKYSYWRYLGYWEESDEIFMLKVIPGERPKTSKLPRSWRRFELQGRFGVDVIEVPDIVRPKYMDVPLGTLTHDEAQKIRRQIVTRLAPIRNLVSKKNFMAVVADSDTRTALVKAAVVQSGMDESTLRKRLTAYWWYGCNRSGMMPLKRGGEGKKRRKFGGKKTGPKPAGYLDSGAAIDLGVQMNPLLYARMARAVQAYVIDKDMSYDEAYDEYLDNDCFATTTVNGETVEAPWDRRRAGSLYQFRRVCQEVLQDIRNRKAKVGKEDADNDFTPRRGHATDLLDHSKQILVLDGVTLPVYLIRDAISCIPMGLANGLAGVCLASGALAAMHVWPNAESGDAYRYCIFNAMSDKKKIAEENGLVSTDGLPRGYWDAILVDGGPAMSESMLETVVKSLGMSRERVRGYTGKAKGTIESFNAYLKKELDKYPGSYTRKIRTRDRQKRKDAADKALLTLAELRQCVWLAIDKLNMESEALEYYTTEMRNATKPEVLPVRADMMRYIQRIRRGDAAPDWSEDELLLRVLPFRQCANREGFIHIGTTTYTSENLQKSWKPKVARNNHKQNPKIWVCQLPGTTNFLVWRKNDGSIEYLHISERDANRYGNMTPQEQKLVARPTDLGKAAKSRKRTNPNRRVRNDVYKRIEAQAKRRIGDRLPMMATMGIAENKRQAIVESDKELGKQLLGVLAQNQSLPAVSVDKLMEPIVVQVYDEHEDNTDLFEANFRA